MVNPLRSVAIGLGRYPSAVRQLIKRSGGVPPLVVKSRGPRFLSLRERGGPMELWHYWVKKVGGILLTDGSELKCLTGVDDHSRLCVMAGLMVRATSRSVCDHFARAMAIHGVPQEILTDNGKVFTGRFNSNKNVEVLFDRICRENGFDHLLTAPRSPTTTGKIERFHRGLRTEFLTGRIFDSKSSAQEELDAWVHQYNTVRPHQGIGMVTPMTRFTSLGNVIVGKHRGGRNVDVHIQNEMVQIWDGAELIKSALRNRPGEVIRKKNAQTTRRK